MKSRHVAGRGRMEGSSGATGTGAPMLPVDPAADFLGEKHPWPLQPGLGRSLKATAGRSRPNQASACALVTTEECESHADASAGVLGWGCSSQFPPTPASRRCLLEMQLLRPVQWSAALGDRDVFTTHVSKGRAARLVLSTRGTCHSGPQGSSGPHRAQCFPGRRGHLGCSGSPSTLWHGEGLLQDLGNPLPCRCGSHMVSPSLPASALALLRGASLGWDWRPRVSCVYSLESFDRKASPGVRGAGDADPLWGAHTDWDLQHHGGKGGPGTEPKGQS